MPLVSEPVRRHRFSPDVIARVRLCFETDNWHGPLEIAEHWLWTVAWTWLSLWAWNHSGLATGIVVYCLAVFFIGGRQRALAGVLHGACHGTVISNQNLSRFLATFFAAYPLLQSFTGYYSSHVSNHHARLGDAERDPDYVHYRELGICGDNLGPRALRRHLLRIVSPRSTLMYISYLLRDRIWNKEEQPRERYIRIAFLLALCIAAAALGQVRIIAAYWLVPLITTQAWIGSIAELLEHYPLIESAPRVDLYVSRNRSYGPLVTFLLGEKKGEQYHLVHHLFPRVPIWRLEEVHGILMEDPEYAALHGKKGFWQSLRGLFEALPKIELANPLTPGSPLPTAPD